jgi:hypothetical protein
MQQPLEYPVAAAQNAIAATAERQVKGPRCNDLDAQLNHQTNLRREQDNRTIAR